MAKNPLAEEKRMKLLQEALSLIMAPRQAKKVCDSLLASLDSFEAIFAAPEILLRSVPGMDDQAVRLLQLVVKLSQAYMEEQSWNVQYVYDTPTAMEALRPKFTGRKTEAVALLLLDSQGRVVYNEIVCEGDFGEVPLHLRQVMQLCIVYQAEDAYIAHNHPSGTLEPSYGDLLVTDRLLTAFRGINVELRDHIIFADNNCFSFKNDGVLDQLKGLVERSQSEQLDRLRSLRDPGRKNDQTE